MTVAWVVHGVTASTSQDHKPPQKGRSKVSRQTMRDSVERQYPNATPARKSRRPLHLRIGLATFGMVIATFCVMTIMPLYWLAFVATTLLTITLVLLSVINDRNKEIYDLSVAHDDLASKLAIANRGGREYLDDVKTINRRRVTSAQTLRERKVRQAVDLYRLGDKHSVESAEAIMQQVRAADKAGLCDVPELRIGTAEREQVISELGDHYAAGRLERDELDTRMDQAGQAKTAVQLAELLRDLP